MTSNRLVISGLSQLSQSFGQGGFVGSSLSGLGTSSSSVNVTSTPCLDTPPLTSHSTSQQMSSSCNVMYSHGSALEQNGLVHHSNHSGQGYGTMSSPQYFSERDPPMEAPTPAPPGKGTKIPRGHNSHIFQLFVFSACGRKALW